MNIQQVNQVSDTLLQITDQCAEIRAWVVGVTGLVQGNWTISPTISGVKFPDTSLDATGQAKIVNQYQTMRASLQTLVNSLP